MGRYTKVPITAFDGLQMDAGILLNNFDISEAIQGNLGFTDENIISATTGGVNPTCKPTISDFADDVDNAPKNTKEFAHLDGWDVGLSTTLLGTSPEVIQRTLGVADIEGGYKIVPRDHIEQTDFKDMWWVGDKANGGFIAIKVENALSTDGFSIQTTKNGKGQLAFNLKGFVSLAQQTKVPMEIYSIDPDEDAEPDITLDKANISLAVNETATIIPTTKPAGQTVTWTTSSSSIATVSDGVVTAKATGTATITATITVDGTNYSDTCSVKVTGTGA